MKHKASVVVAVVLLGIASIVYAGMRAAGQQDGSENPQTIRRLLGEFFKAQATAPFRYPTACVAGTAEEYTQMALRAAMQDAGGVQLHLWTVPEPFGRVDQPEPDRKSGRCDYRVAPAGESQGAHVIAEFFSRKHPRTGEIAYVKVWQQGGHEAVLVSFPNGPRGMDPHITFKTVPVDQRLGSRLPPR
ncbi:MAG TPA: hypothetical protein VF264_03125 [Rhodanobacteraceae bacterium]